MGDFKVNIDDAPPFVFREGPEIGEVYKKNGGPAGFMLIVSNNGSTHGYLAIDREGRVTGIGQGTSYYFSLRMLVGRVQGFPSFEIEWDR